VFLCKLYNTIISVPFLYRDIKQKELSTYPYSNFKLAFNITLLENLLIKLCYFLKYILIVLFPIFCLLCYFFKIEKHVLLRTCCIINKVFLFLKKINEKKEAKKVHMIPRIKCPNL
jgi:hypothetical protein